MVCQVSLDDVGALVHEVEVGCWVYLFFERERWFAQSPHFNILGDGATKDEALRQFLDFLQANIEWHLENGQSLDKMIQPAHPDVFAKLERITFSKPKKLDASKFDIPEHLKPMIECLVAQDAGNASRRDHMAR